jgi:hypothetical protein
MLEIVQAKDYKKYGELFEKLKIEDEIISVVEAMDNKKVIGCGIYHFDEKSVIVDYIDSGDDLQLYDGIVRSILFLAMNNGINRAVFNFDDYSDLVKLKFTNGKDNFINDISEILVSCKKCNI